MRKNLLQIGFMIIIIWILMLIMAVTGGAEWMFWGILVFGLVLLGLGLFLKEKQGK